MICEHPIECVLILTKLKIEIRSNHSSVTYIRLTRRMYNTTWSRDIAEVTEDPCYSLSRPMMLRDYNGTFQSKGYPTSYYWNSANCQWLIQSQVEFGVSKRRSRFSQWYLRLYDMVGTLKLPLFRCLRDWSPGFLCVYLVNQYKEIVWLLLKTLTVRFASSMQLDI